MKKAKKRAVPIGLIILEIFLITLFAFLSLWWFGKSYKDFYSVASKEAAIPGLDTKLSPQGICALPENDEGYTFAMSGYISGEPSRVYLISENFDTERYITFTDNGKAVKTHFGGVSCTENYLLVASGKKIIRAALSDVYAAQNGSAVAVYDSFETGLSNAFCYVYGDELYAGEFYRPGNYETDASHHIEVGGGVNHAFVYVFPIDETLDGGVAQKVPTKALSVCDQVQGIVVTDDTILLSTSYGLPDSELRFCANPMAGEGDSELDFDGVRVPLYILDADKKGTFTMPCMSEEMCLKDGKLYILFESRSGKYRYFVRHRITKILSIDLNKLLEMYP